MKMMIRTCAILAAVLAVGVVPGAARAADATSGADKAFIAKVSQGGMFEVAAGKLAATQGDAQDVKDMGATEAHDHGLVGARLTSIAAAAGIRFPDTLNPLFQKELDGLKAKSGPEFDEAFVSDMLDIHAKDGAAFAQEAKGGTNPKLREFAVATRRIVLRHVGALKAIGPGQ
jgi:putative membrane protein